MTSISASAEQFAQWRADGWHQYRGLGEVCAQSFSEFPEAVVRWDSALKPASASFADIGAEVGRASAGLASLGVSAGDVVAIQLPNWRENLVLLHACFRLGLIVLPIIHSYGPAELNFILGQSQAEVLVMPDRWRHINYIERVTQLEAASRPERLIVIGEDVPDGAASWTELLSGNDSISEPVPVDPSDVCALVYTSGTTGRPKGVQHSHNTLLTRAIAGFAGAPAGRHVEFTMLPSGHITGVMRGLRIVTSGSDAIYMDEWDAGRALALIEQHRVTVFGATPFFLTEMLAHPDFAGRDLSSVQSVMVGGANVPSDLIRVADAGGWPAMRSYGMTEHPTAFVSRFDDNLAARATTDGRIECGAEVRLVDDEGRNVPEGEWGEIVLSGPAQFVGYREPSDNEGAFLEPGWFRTGDLGTLNDRGYLTVVGRKKDVIIRGGENISSAEVEEVLQSCSGIREAAAIGYPDARYGERVCAVIVMEPDVDPISVEGLKAEFKEKGVATFKLPERIAFVDELPRSTNGKVLKAKLRDDLFGENDPHPAQANPRTQAKF